MSNVSGIVEPEDVVGKPTLVRRVSKMLKDGNYSGPPILFRHASMQKIRHCCQNLNLFPYLLYSYDNSKSHPLARKVHLCFGQFLKEITERILFLYKTVRQSVLRGIHAEQSCAQEEDLEYTKESSEPVKSTSTFPKLIRQKRKENPFFLILAVYFAPLILAFQLIGLVNLMVLGKYTPGFIFLITALMFLGCISLKIMFHETVVYKVKYEKNKVQ